MIRRHIAYVWSLNYNLRGTRKEDFTKVFEYLDKDSKEVGQLNSAPNPCTAINKVQGEELAELFKKGEIDPSFYYELVVNLDIMIDCQGKAERILKTPLYRPYAYFTTVFYWIFISLLIIVYVQDMGIWTIALAPLIAFAFQMLIDIGISSEDPFNTTKSALPLDALANTIERDLTFQIDLPVPEATKPIDGVLN